MAIEPGLKACPHCGGKVWMQRVADWPDFVIRCNGCQLWTVIEPREGSARQEMINDLGAKWNRRSPVSEPTSPFPFVAWFSNDHLDEDDQDKEWAWLVCIHAASESAAQQWGDRLAAEHCKGTSDRLTCSYIDPDPSGPLDEWPLTRVGDPPFRPAFAAKLATVLLPVLQRARADIGRLAGTVAGGTDAGSGGPEAEIVECDKPEVIELQIMHPGGVARLAFHPHDLDFSVHVLSDDYPAAQRQLSIDQITEETVAQLVAEFVERALSQLPS
jgi:hypothetical protein